LACDWHTYNIEAQQNSAPKAQQIYISAGTGRYFQASFIEEMENSARLSQVSTLYGPGTTGAWLLTLLSVLVTWTVNVRSKKKDTITNDLIAALSLPTIAAIHLFYELHLFSGSTQDLLTSTDSKILQHAAKIEAPLVLCETFSAFAITLVGISNWYGHMKRTSGVMTIGILCFSTEIILLIGSRGIASSTMNLARPFVFCISGLIITITITLVLLLCSFFACLLVRPVTHSDPQSENQLVREYGSYKWRRMTTYSTFFVAVVSLPLTLLCGSGSLVEIALKTVSLKSRVLFFIPKTSSSIGDLDQAVALAAGFTTLGFSIYDAYKSIVAQDTVEFEEWRASRHQAQRSALQSIELRRTHRELGP
jgi:hypothetical protein